MVVQKQRISLEEDVLRLADSPAERDRLIANKCGRCGMVFFPKRHYCGKCCQPDLIEIALSPIGRLRSFAVVNQKPRDSAIEPPYVEGEVEMPEGIRVISVIKGAATDMKIGMDMELVTEKIREDEKGNEIVAFEFKPVNS